MDQALQRLRVPFPSFLESSYSASYLNNTHREASESAETVATVLKISTQRSKYLGINTERAKKKKKKKKISGKDRKEADLGLLILTVKVLCF